MGTGTLLWASMTNKKRKELIREHEARLRKDAAVAAGEIPAGRPDAVADAPKLTYIETPATSMEGRGSEAARLEIYQRVLADVDERAKWMKEHKEFGDDRMAPTKWRNAKLRWWRAILGLDEKGNPR